MNLEHSLFVVFFHRDPEAVGLLFHATTLCPFGPRCLGCSPVLGVAFPLCHSGSLPLVAVRLFVLLVESFHHFAPQGFKANLLWRPPISTRTTSRSITQCSSEQWSTRNARPVGLIGFCGLWRRTDPSVTRRSQWTRRNWRRRKNASSSSTINRQQVFQACSPCILGYELA